MHSRFWRAEVFKPGNASLELGVGDFHLVASGLDPTLRKKSAQHFLPIGRKGTAHLSQVAICQRPTDSKRPPRRKAKIAWYRNRAPADCSPSCGTSISARAPPEIVQDTISGRLAWFLGFFYDEANSHYEEDIILIPNGNREF
jgi:hypothetical protein